MDDRTGLSDLVILSICRQTQLDERDVRVLFSYARHCNYRTVSNFYDISERKVWEIVVNNSMALHNWARLKTEVSRLHSKRQEQQGAVF